MPSEPPDGLKPGTAGPDGVCLDTRRDGVGVRMDGGPGGVEAGRQVARLPARVAVVVVTLRGREVRSAVSHAHRRFVSGHVGVHEEVASLLGRLRRLLLISSHVPWQQLPRSR